LNRDPPPLIVTAMRRISIIAIVTAFMVEVAVDMVISFMLMFMFAIGTITPGMTEVDVQKATEAISNSGAYLAAVVVCGTATTIGGGYFAARLARTFPYYNGLAIGIVGLAWCLYFWRMNPLWLSIFSIISVIPASIFGAHLAKPHLPAEE